MWKRKAITIHCGKRKLEGGDCGYGKLASFHCAKRKLEFKEELWEKKACIRDCPERKLESGNLLHLWYRKVSLAARICLETIVLKNNKELYSLERRVDFSVEKYRNYNSRK